MAQAPTVSAARPQLMVSAPGVGRDGTRFSQKTYLEMLWCRTYQGLPRKMGGYLEQLRSVNGIVRAIDVFTNEGYSYVHLGTGNALQRYAIDNMTGANTGLMTRTPVGFVSNPLFAWQFAQMFDIPTDSTVLFANATLSAKGISSATPFPVYYGDIIGDQPFQMIQPGTEFTASIAGTTMTVTAMDRGELYEGVKLYAPGLAPGTVIEAVTTEYDPGPPSVPGVYTISPSQTLASTTFTAHKVEASGGIVAVALTLFTYGHDGIIQWSTPNNSFDFLGVGSGDARPVGDKIVRGMPLRGQSGPAIILWSLSSVIIGTFVGSPLWWDFTTVTTNSSVMSSNGFVEHEGIYYWATTSGFSMFNGVVRELPNTDNKQWFLDNVNWQHRQKVFAYKIPRWSEIWWCFPFGTATECTHAVIYNWAEKKWYDTVLPNGGRSAGFYEFIYNYPIMAGVEPHGDTSGGTSMWQHETGLNEVSGPVPVPRAIISRFRTHEFNVISAQPGQQGIDQGISFSVLEPDFDQKGPLNFTVTSRANARARERITGPITIVEVPTTPAEQLVRFKHSGRLTSFTIESNALGGNYISGHPLIHWQPGDARRED